MPVLHDILAWSAARPSWQRDALRRLVLRGDLSAEDLEDLAEICKAAHGLSDLRDVVPLAGHHLPMKEVGPIPSRFIPYPTTRESTRLPRTRRFASPLVSPSSTATTPPARPATSGSSRARAEPAVRSTSSVTSLLVPRRPHLQSQSSIGMEPNPRSTSGHAPGTTSRSPG